MDSGDKKAEGDSLDAHPNQINSGDKKAQGDSLDAHPNQLPSYKNNDPPALFAELSADIDSVYYNMNHKRRGIAIILNHEVFDIPSLKSRAGTKVDCENLSNTLTKLGFEVKVFHDLSYKEVIQTVDEAAKSDHSDCDCFVMAILSHGELGIIYAKDSPYKPEFLWSPFTADRCPKLAGKPKLFFIQACQGDKLDPGITLSRTEVDGSPLSYKIPTQADFLIAYSTVPGYFSWRNTTNGSWFMQALCWELKRRGTTCDILTLLTFVCQRVAIDFESNTPDNFQMHKQKQIPCITSMLTRLLRFRDKL